ncbi:equilibrative nucleotide transporter 8-like [Humulus lupulus]|uniref:equilibrative nucleotide transporter 8-like n=1 Tax=Humulus lupulus TaxID=3486 RepID=UPI002B402852|nr:equilibrative nucleotide transporter 8-like [Humulus lupulus]
MINVKTAADQPEPRDTYKIAYIIHFLLGAGNLLPWNAFITGADYFGFLYPNRHVEKVFFVAYMSCSKLNLVLMLIRGSCYGKLRSRLTLNLGFSMFVLSLMVAPLIDWLWSTESSEKTYGVIVASVAIWGITDGLVGGNLMGSAGRLPKQYMQAVFAGTTSSGTTCIHSFSYLLLVFPSYSTQIMF